MRRLLALLPLALAVSAQADSGWVRYRLTVRNAKDVQRVNDCSLTLFSEDVQIGETDVAVGPGQQVDLLALNLPYRRISSLPNPEKWYLREGPATDDFRSNYLRYDDIIAQYEVWRAAYPELVTRTNIGTSWNGRTIWAYRFFYAYNGDRQIRQSVICGFGIHAREWISPAVGMHLFDQLIQNTASRSFFSTVPLGTAFYFIPVQNPDGYEYCWTNNRMWRKNRRANSGGSFGVDLNRNYSKGWGLSSGSSGTQSSETYRGPSAFSEPESRIVRDFVGTIAPVAGYIDWHSYGEKILWPWSYQTPLAQGDVWMRSTGVAVKNAMFAHSGHSYTAGPAATTLYLSSGTTKDYFYDRFNAVSYTIELRDTGDFGFLLPESQIIPSQDEAWEGFKAFVPRILDR